MSNKDSVNEGKIMRDLAFEKLRQINEVIKIFSNKSWDIKSKYVTISFAFVAAFFLWIK